MKIEIYHTLPEGAMIIRQTVFVEEQGFIDEYDEHDPVATHFVLFDDLSHPVATCRVFPKEGTKDYYLGRMAVMKSFRGRHLGALVLQAAEDYVHTHDGNAILLHSQCSAEGFYTACGYTSIGKRDEEQGCPHVWMKKVLS